MSEETSQGEQIRSVCIPELFEFDQAPRVGSYFDLPNKY